MRRAYRHRGGARINQGTPSSITRMASVMPRCIHSGSHCANHAGHGGSGFLQAADITGFVLYHPPGHTVRRQQHRNMRAYLRREAFQSLLHSLCQGLQKEGLEMPVSSYFEIEIIALQVRNRVFQCANVAAHDDR